MISKAGSLIVTVTVFLFAVFLIINFSMGSYFVCLILPIGFIMMTAGLHNECESERKVAANIGLILAEWYLAFSEKRELLGNTNHLLYICRKL